MGPLSRLSTVALLLWLVGCGKTGPRTLRDSEGRTFSALCAEGRCKIEQKAGPQREGKQSQAILGAGRLVGICDVASSEAEPETHDCRPLLCESDADCPPDHGMKDGQCLNGRCSDPAGEVSVKDAILLCLAGTGLGRSTPRQVERYALALNCGSPCRVPAPCQKP
jgi:hypothetical protein